MCRHLNEVVIAGFELARRANCIGEENKDLKAQDPSEKVASLEKELAKVKAKLVGSHRINLLLNTEKKQLMEDYLGLPKRHEDATSQLDKLKAEISGFDLQITQLNGRLEDVASQHPKKLWAAVENFKQSAELFKKSPEFLDALWANAAYGVCTLFRKYKEKYPGFRADYIEFQEGYNPSWLRSSPWMPLPMTRKMKTKPLLLVELSLMT
ncbi:hypothetical protein LIER_06751 [Lithospermum erythrorhizon]|uniref:Uncharacterized protein n=1 Tax=Lithospermum erythrorhizon TaxID=34254 RepID=A0AAV3P7H2_LITER